MGLGKDWGFCSSGKMRALDQGDICIGTGLVLSCSETQGTPYSQLLPKGCLEASIPLQFSLACEGNTQI